MIERTLLLLKPNAVADGNIGNIIRVVEEHNFTIIALEMLEMDRELAETFYSAHQDKLFFNKLIAFMTSGKSVAMILEKDNAVTELRELSGDTDPKKAEANTIRRLYGLNVTRNGVHSSDSITNAKREIELLFQLRS